MDLGIVETHLGYSGSGLGSTSASVAAYGTVIDLGSNASVAKRQMKLVGAALITAGAPEIDLSAVESSASASGFTDCGGDTFDTITAGGAFEYLITVNKRYLKLGTAAWTSTAGSATMVLLAQDIKRVA